MINKNIKNNLPLNRGERPLFKSRSILEILMRDISRKEDVYYSTKTKDIENYIAAINVLSDILNLRVNTGRRQNSNDLYKEIQNLPLFFSAENIKHWELERVWSNKDFCHYSNIINEYANLLDSENPSNAYITDSESSKYIWKQWFDITPYSSIATTLSLSAQRWLEWESNRYNKGDDFILTNMSFFAKKLELNNNEYKAWKLFENLTYNSQFESLWNIALTELGNINDLFNIWEISFNLEKNSIIKLFSQDSIFVKLGIYNAIVNCKDESFSKIILKLKKNHYMYNLLDRTLKNSLDFFSLFIDMYQENQLNLNSWDYIKDDVENLQNILKSGGSSILLYGVNGCGKSSLVASLLKATNKTGWTPKENKNNENKSLLENNLLLADKLLLNENNILVFDNSKSYLINKDEKKIIKDYLIATKITSIWIINDLSELDKEVINIFDSIFELKEMPLTNKVQLVQKDIQDKTVSLKIAQAVRTPKEIHNIIKWCKNTNLYTWENILKYINNTNKALLNSDYKPLLKEIIPDENLVNFAGYPEVEELLEDLEDYFNNPQIYKDIGAKIPSGVLLMGPPGTGKTHFAKQLVKRVGIPMFLVETSLLISKVEYMNQMFEEAKRYAPCILLMDEIDTLINNPLELGQLNLEKQKILNSFLTNLSGINDASGVFVIGTTHRNITPDPAAIRSGRLSKVIHLSLPNFNSRKEIWKSHLKQKVTHENIDYDILATCSSNFSGAEIAESLNGAALLSAKKREEKISMSSLLTACDNVFWGALNSSNVLSDDEKYKTAIHEAGHALIAWKNGLSVSRITIRPRSNFLGAIQWDREEGVITLKKSDVLKQIELGLGGLASEKLIFDEFSSGALGDLKYIKSLLHNIILSYGFGEVNHLNYIDPNSSSMWSENKKIAIEKEEKDLLELAMKNCSSWLDDNKDLLKDLATHLLDVKELSGTDLKIWKDKVNIENKNLYFVNINSPRKKEILASENKN